MLKPLLSLSSTRISSAVTGLKHWPFRLLVFFYNSELISSYLSARKNVFASHSIATITKMCNLKVRLLLRILIYIPARTPLKSVIYLYHKPTHLLGKFHIIAYARYPHSVAMSVGMCCRSSLLRANMLKKRYSKSFTIYQEDRTSRRYDTSYVKID